MSSPKELRSCIGMVLPFPSAATSPGAAAEIPWLTFTWSMVEQQLSELAGSPQRRALAATLVSATRKQAPFKPAALVLREVLCIAAVLMDESFHPESQGGEMT
jgi:hypothetical protein